ncbi:MAG: hypothetical protein U5K81_16170 [Trueperaceae bacterium]|nr:hypothetical protein [Trueperaceae bacterium]
MSALAPVELVEFARRLRAHAQAIFLFAEPVEVVRQRRDARALFVQRRPAPVQFAECLLRLPFGRREPGHRRFLFATFGARLIEPRHAFFETGQVLDLPFQRRPLGAAGLLAVERLLGLLDLGPGRLRGVPCLLLPCRRPLERLAGMVACLPPVGDLGGLFGRP